MYAPSDTEAVVLELRSWIAGFVQKEYGTHVDPQDQQDLVQEGCLSLLIIVQKLAKKPPRFTSEDEYTFYVKAVVRNAVRDYIIKYRSRFEISLYKLRKHKRETGQELGEFMTDVGDEFAYLHDEAAEDPAAWETRQRRLSLLSEIRKSGRGMSDAERQETLARILREYRTHLVEELSWSAPTPVREPVVDPDTAIPPTATLPHQRTPLASGHTTDRPVPCRNRFCGVDLRSVRNPIINRGYGYCSKACRKEWPPIIVKLQAQYEMPIEIVLLVGLKLFKSKRRTAEILNMATSTMERLIGRFGIDTAKLTISPPGIEK